MGRFICLAPREARPGVRAPARARREQRAAPRAWPREPAQQRPALLRRRHTPNDNTGPVHSVSACQGTWGVASARDRPRGSELRGNRRHSRPRNGGVASINRRAAAIDGSSAPGFTPWGRAHVSVAGDAMGGVGLHCKLKYKKPHSWYNLY
eukprot:3053497-Rhodomonas_salina.2